MERKSNITIWQLRLFEGLNKDIMVMQRNEEEVFDDAIHVFFEKEYYDAYVNKAKRYGNIVMLIMKISWVRLFIRFLMRISQVWYFISILWKMVLRRLCVMKSIYQQKT